jgi:PilZ domain
MSVSDRPNHYRAVSRLAVSLPGSVRARDPDLAWNRDVRVVDLGLGGACVAASDAAPTGTAIELVIETPHLWDPLTLTGAVAWSRALADTDGGGTMLGICFELATSASVRALAELLEAEAFS